MQRRRGLVPAITLERSVALEGGALGSPVPFPSQDAAEAVLVTLASGKIVLLNPAGQPAASMQLDLAPTAPAVLGRLAGKAAPEVLAADVAGSIYCFNARGERLWKHTRTGKAADFRVLVVADIDGDGQPEVLLSDSRGHLFAVDSSGRLRLEVTATRYRVSAPAVGDLDGDGVPELVFGTEDNEMYCLNGRGEFLWRRSLEGRFGRALPVLADPERDGKLKVFVSTPFVGPSPGLYSLDGATGAVRWQARSVLQSYHSIAVADVDGDGQAEIFYGDKNTRLFCVNARGQHRWATQLGGRGIFFAPAIAEVEGRARIFQVVRGAGLEGHSLYTLDSAGKVVEALALQGGGNSSPRLCRFQGRRELSLLVFDSSKNLLTYRLPEGKILWPAPAPVTARPSPQRASPPRPPVRPLLAGRNTIQLTRPAGGALALMRVAGPDGAVQVKLAREEDTAGFEAREPGAYDLTLQWFNRDNARLHQERRAYALDSGFSEDARLAGSFDAPASPLAGYFEATAKAGWDLARKQRDIGLLERLRADRAYASALLAYLAREPVRGPVLVRQLANPWAALDPAAFVERPNRLELAMLGNEYESAALAV
ncbi:MAG: PQQ-like beta-propeller repeat protein, partial [Acidobacteria bacterium]|nr:PQQ-like beta-propeller repeat protein [Acidobacteriota bacterium]